MRNQYKLTKKTTICIVLLAVFMSLIIFSSSPIYDVCKATDLHIYLDIADNMLKGKVLYKDILDWKGVFLFEMYAFIQLLLGGKKTILAGYIISLLSYLGHLIISYKYMQDYNKNQRIVKWIIYILLYNSIIMEGLGGNPEEFISLFWLITLYECKIGTYKRVKIGEDTKLDRFMVFLVGIFIGIVAFVKISWGVLWFVLYVGIAINYLKENIKALGKLAYLTTLGFIIPTSISIGYCIKTHCLKEFYNIYIRDNLTYGKTYTLKEKLFSMFIYKDLYSKENYIIEFIVLLLFCQVILQKIISYREYKKQGTLKNKNLYLDTIILSYIIGYYLTICVTLNRVVFYYLPMISLVLVTPTKIYTKKIINILKCIVILGCLGVLNLYGLTFCFNEAQNTITNMEITQELKKEKYSEAEVSTLFTAYFVPFISKANNYSKYFFIPITVHINNQDFWNGIFEQYTEQKTDYIIIPYRLESLNDEIIYNHYYYNYTLITKDKENTKHLVDIVLENYEKDYLTSDGRLAIYKAKRLED